LQLIFGNSELKTHFSAKSEGHKSISLVTQCNMGQQNSTAIIRSSRGRRNSWRNCESTTQKSPTEETQDSKKREREQHKAETQEEQHTLLKRRTVSFSPVIETFHTLVALDDCTPECSASWFDEDDYEYYDFTYNCEKTSTVSFAPVIEIFHSLALADYTPEEISASWFDEDDYDDFTYNCEKIRTVSFADVIESFQILALDDYTQEEISASWFDDDDYDDIVADCVKIIMNNKSDGFVTNNEDCIRGLERMNDIGLALLNCNRNDSYDAVLEEQGVQRDNQEQDYHGDRIARLYREVASRRCHVEAQQRGMQDALVVEELILLDEGRNNKDEKALMRNARCACRWSSVTRT
jgi:hypothetical protein